MLVCLYVTEDRLKIFVKDRIFKELGKYLFLTNIKFYHCLNNVKWSLYRDRKTQTFLRKSSLSLFPHILSGEIRLNATSSRKSFLSTSSVSLPIHAALRCFQSALYIHSHDLPSLTVEKLVLAPQGNSQSPSSHLKMCKEIIFWNINLWGFPAGSVGKESTCKAEMQVRSLSQEDRLEEGMATRFSVLARRIPWTEEPGRLRSIASQSWTGLKWLGMHVHIQ